VSAALPRVELAPGYSISRLLKGGWQLASGHGAHRTRAAGALGDMDRFVDAGITTFDCADIYTGVEELIGRWLRQRRERGAAGDVQLHTKYVPDLEGLRAHSRADVVRGVERSLLRLGVDRLDLVQLHWWDFDVPGYVEAAGWLDDLRREGKVRFVGVTNFDRTRLAEIIAAGVPIATHQVQYSVLDRRPAREMAAFCAERGIGLLCYGALAGGFLGERYLNAPDPAPPLENRSLVKYRLIIDEFGGWERHQDLLRALARVAARHGVGIGAVAIRWVLDRPGVSGVIVGARHAGHLAEIVRAAAVVLDDEDRAAIGRVLDEAPGPAGDVYELERVKGGRHAAVMRYSLNRGAG
jgi:aryl-alcohol dehydrogenase-like predicted oxidoreductase